MNTCPCDISKTDHCVAHILLLLYFISAPQILSMAEVQTRVQDYLDDQIQTAADLDGIDALLTRVAEQQGLLQRQVSLS